MTTETIQIRRGLNSQRTSVIFAQGEPVWTTDTQAFYIGDGTTPGGIFVASGSTTTGGGTSYSFSGLGTVTVTTIGNIVYISGATSSGNFNTSGYITTGNADARYYPLNSNPSAFIEQGSGLSQNFPLNGNFLTVQNSGDTIARIGNATIVGTDINGNPYFQSNGQIFGFDVSGNVVWDNHPFLTNNGILTGNGAGISNLNTGILSGAFYPFGSNPSGYLTSGSNSPIILSGLNSSTLSTLTLGSGIPVFTSDGKEVFVGDGATAGGIPIVYQNSKIVYVSQSKGSDTRLGGSTTFPEKYNPNKPFATLTNALNAASAGDTILALDGAFTDKNINLKPGVSWIFYPKATINITSASANDAIFTSTSNLTGVNIQGFGQTFTLTGTVSSNTIWGLNLASTTSNINISNLNMVVSNGGSPAAATVININASTVTWIGGCTISGNSNVGTTVQVNANGGNIYFDGIVGASQGGSALYNVSNNSFVTLGSIIEPQSSSSTSYTTNLTLLHNPSQIQYVNGTNNFVQSLNFGAQDGVIEVTGLNSSIANGTINFPAEGRTRIGQQITIANYNTGNYIISGLSILVNGIAPIGYSNQALYPGAVQFLKSATGVWLYLNNYTGVSNPSSYFGANTGLIITGNGIYNDGLSGYGHRTNFCSMTTGTGQTYTGIVNMQSGFPGSVLKYLINIQSGTNMSLSFQTSGGSSILMQSGLGYSLQTSLEFIYNGTGWLNTYWA